MFLNITEYCQYFKIFFLCPVLTIFDIRRRFDFIACVLQFRMTEFGTLEIVTDLEVKGQETQPNRETLDPAPSHTPTPPPEGQSQAGTAKAPANQNQPGSSQGKGIPTHD